MQWQPIETLPLRFKEKRKYLLFRPKDKRLEPISVVVYFVRINSCPSEYFVDRLLRRVMCWENTQDLYTDWLDPDHTP